MGLPKPKEKNSNRQLRENRLRDDVILESILQNEYILVIGSEAILKPDLEGTDNSGNSLVLLYNAMLQERGILLPPKSWSEKEWQNFFRQQHIHKDLLESVEEIIRNGDEDGSYYKLDDISEELDALVRTKHFPVIITTSVDGYLELLMRDVWGDNLQIVNFNEDKCRSRVDNSGENLAVIRHIALNLYKSFSSTKLSMKAKRFRCSFDDDFLCSVIFHKFS